MICWSHIFRKGYWECTKVGNSTCFHKVSDLLSDPPSLLHKVSTPSVRPTQPPTQSVHTFCQTHSASYTKCSDILSDPPSLLHKVFRPSVRPTKPPTQCPHLLSDPPSLLHKVSTPSVRPIQPPTQSVLTFCQTHSASYTKRSDGLSDPPSLVQTFCQTHLTSHPVGART